MGRQAECGLLAAIDPHFRCVALHVFEGLLTILPINTNYSPPSSEKGQTKRGDEESEDESTRMNQGPSIFGEAFHCRIEEQALLAMTFLESEGGDPQSSMPQVCLLHQDARGSQHLVSHLINLRKQQLHLFGSQSAPATTQWLKKSSIDGGSALLVPVPPRFLAGIVAPPVATAASSRAPDEPDPSMTASSVIPKLGGVIVLGQRQFTYCSPTVTKVMPVPQALFLSYEVLPPDPNGMPRFLIGDEFGNLHMLTLLTVNHKVVSIQFDTLGSCTLSSCLAYLGDGLVYVGSNLGDSQLVQIHDEPIIEEETDDLDLADSTYLTVVEEYTNLGPILDFDLVPTTPGAVPGVDSANSPVQQSQVVTASGSSKSGSLRLIRNGIGMNEYASVEIPGIQNMWSIRKSFDDQEDAYLVQSFVGETRVLGVTSGTPEDTMEEDETEEEVGGTLEEVILPGLEASASTLFVGNVGPGGDRLIQITKAEIRLFSLSDGAIFDTWQHGGITVAAANEAGQVAVAMGGTVAYFAIEGDQIKKLGERLMEQEISCLDLRPFTKRSKSGPSSMDIDEPKRSANKSSFLAVGLWDDFTVRLLSIESNLEQVASIDLSTTEDDDTDETTGAQRNSRNNMVARSLCLLTLDLSSSPGAGGSSCSGVDMLFVGLGDGTLISFAVVSQKGAISVRCRKEVCLGTQRIDLVPLVTDGGGTCVLATGDRPTVIYLTGVGGTSDNQFNPKLCYSNVNLSANEDGEGDDVSRLPSQQVIAVNVAAPFASPLLFDATAFGNQHYSLCVADDSNLRLGVIDDIQKLHVTTCRLGMAPRRIVHCQDGRLFAVGCIESGIKHFGLGGEEANMGNCIRFMDDTTFDDIERIDLEPFEMILTMCYATLKVPVSGDTGDVISGDQEKSDSAVYKPFLLVGTAYAIPDEDEPEKGRVLVYSFQADDPTAGNSRVVRQVTEMSVQGGVYSICQFFDGKFLCSIRSKTMVCELVDDSGLTKLEFVGTGHHGHILSLFVKSRAQRIFTDSSASRAQSSMVEEKESVGDEKKGKRQDILAIVGDLMRSISLVQYYPEHKTLEEVARDFNSKWTVAVEMLNDRVYLGAENWNNLYCVSRNSSSSEEVRCRLDTIGEFHLGEMCNKFMSGSLVMPVTANSNETKRRRGTSPIKKSSSGVSSNSTGSPPSSRKGTSAAARTRRPVILVGSQTLFGTVDGSLGVVLGLDGRSAAFFSTLERAMATKIRPIGDLDHQIYRSCQGESGRIHPAHGFVDGDLVETFLDLDRSTMLAVVEEMNRDGGWEVDDAVLRRVGGGQKPEEGDGGDDSMEQERSELSVEDVVAMVEEMSMMH